MYIHSIYNEDLITVILHSIQGNNNGDNNNNDSNNSNNKSLIFGGYFVFSLAIFRGLCSNVYMIYFSIKR